MNKNIDDEKYGCDKDYPNLPREERIKIHNQLWGIKPTQEKITNIYADIVLISLIVFIICCLLTIVWR